MLKLHHKFMILLLMICVVLAGSAVHRRSASLSGSLLPLAPENADAALWELQRGNARFVNSRRTHSTDTSHDAEQRRRMADDQHPFVALLCCSDSRVCPEFIFDQRAGSIFEIRNAGNVVNEDVLGSVEYALEHLHVPLVVVLGHKGCGAIEAVCKAGDSPLHGYLRSLQLHMLGISQQVLACNHRHDAAVVNRLSEENARQQALTMLRESTVLKESLLSGNARILYALYDMESGEVQFFPLAADF